MKKIFILSLVLSGFAALVSAQNTILEARGMAVGTVVTLKGLVTNGSELGSIRYFQDNTAGIAAYGSLVNSVNLGDSVTITGTLKNYYGLLELDPLSNVTIRSTGNNSPEPIVLTPAQIGETHESRLVKINNAIFADAGTPFTAPKKYTFTANGETGYLYVNTGQDLVGQNVPIGLVNITAILSQRTYTGSGGYQILPRTMADLQMASSIYLNSSLNNTNVTQSELDFSWTTNIAGTTEMFYGLSPETVRENQSAGTGGSTSHTISLSSLPTGDVIWVQAFSVSESDTAFSGITPFVTISNSTGDIKVYFNTPVNHSYSNGVNATYLYQAIDDTLIKHISRAKYTIDLAIYNFNNDGISNISNALNAAAARGVVCRIIGCGTSANLGIGELTGTNMNTLIGPGSSGRSGLMHNKFFLFDTESTDANDPIVWTGSTNLTSGNINLDANNVIIIQDQSLARAYKIEFEEMWGSTSNSPNASKARFGSFKTNNTPHEFIINGKRVESYFSPTDGVNSKIVQTVATSNNDLSIATMLLTRDEIASAIASSHASGSATNMLTNAQGNNGTTVNATLLGALGVSHYVFYSGTSGVMHNKYMIVDQGAVDSDPMVFTGSHNWSAAADNDNDENSLIIHDATIANIYYQNFVHLFTSNNGVLTEIESPVNFSNNQLAVFPNPVKDNHFTVSFSNSVNETGTIQLIDITGKVVHTSSVKIRSGDNSFGFNIPNSSKGFYILRISTASRVLNHKVLVEQ
jgi:phosphatidylserine/phosphatidylglycerophosphate/cardiolipin synthase-like enzyme